LGVAVLDMGRTTTGLSVYRDRRIMATACFEWGGYHLTRDVAAGLQISFEEADELILEYGISHEYIGMLDASRDGISRILRNAATPIKLKTAVHGVSSVAERDELDMIIYERAHELMKKTHQYLTSRGLTKHLIRGVVLTGGSSSIQNYAKLAESVFQVPCRAGEWCTCLRQ